MGTPRLDRKVIERINMGIYNTAAKQLEKGKRWLWTKAVFLTVKHYLPGIMSNLTAAIAAHELNFLQILEPGQILKAPGFVIALHVNMTVLKIAGAALGFPLAAGFVGNRRKWKKRHPVPLGEETTTVPTADLMKAREGMTSTPTHLAEIRAHVIEDDDHPVN